MTAYQYTATFKAPTEAAIKTMDSTVEAASDDQAYVLALHAVLEAYGHLNWIVTQVCANDQQQLRSRDV
jgi:hypothetical protein